MEHTMIPVDTSSHLTRRLTPVLTYLSSLELVLVVLRFGEFAFSCVSQVSVDGEKNVGVGSRSVHITCPHGHLVRVSCDRAKT